MAEFAFYKTRAGSAQLPEGSFFQARCPAIGRLPGTLGQLEVVRSRHPGRYPKLEGSTLSHPAFGPLTEHQAFSTGLFYEAQAPQISLGVKTMLSCASQHNESAGTPSFGPGRFYRFFNRNSKFFAAQSQADQQRDEQVADALRATTLVV